MPNGGTVSQNSHRNVKIRIFGPHATFGPLSEGACYLSEGSMLSLIIFRHFMGCLCWPILVCGNNPHFRIVCEID
jgi:hypothetical protein